MCNVIEASFHLFHILWKKFRCTVLLRMVRHSDIYSRPEQIHARKKCNEQSNSTKIIALFLFLGNPHGKKISGRSSYEYGSTLGLEQYFNNLLSMDETLK